MTTLSDRLRALAAKLREGDVIIDAWFDRSGDAIHVVDPQEVLQSAAEMLEAYDVTHPAEEREAFDQYVQGWLAGRGGDDSPSVLSEAQERATAMLEFRRRMFGPEKRIGRPL